MRKEVFVPSAQILKGRCWCLFLPPNATAFRRTLSQIGIVREALGVQAQDYPERG